MSEYKVNKTIIEAKTEKEVYNAMLDWHTRGLGNKSTLHGPSIGAWLDAYRDGMLTRKPVTPESFSKFQQLAMLTFQFLDWRCMNIFKLYHASLQRRAFNFSNLTNTFPNRASWELHTSDYPQEAPARHLVLDKIEKTIEILREYHDSPIVLSTAAAYQWLFYGVGPVNNLKDALDLEKQVTDTYKAVKKVSETKEYRIGDFVFPVK